MFLFTFFFAAAHFHLVSISSFSHRRFKTFQFIFQRNRSLLCPLFFLPFLCYPRQCRHAKFKSNRLCCCCCYCCCCCFYLKKSRMLCDLPPKRMGASKAKFHPGLHEWVDVSIRTDHFFRTPNS